MGQIKPHHYRHSIPPVDPLCRNRSRMGHGINKPDAHPKQVHRQSTMNGRQANPGASQYQPLAFSLPRIRMANMELSNDIIKDEDVLPLTQLHQPNHSIITGDGQNPARRLGNSSRTPVKCNFPHRHPRHSTRMAAATTALGNSPKTSGHRRAPI